MNYILKSFLLIIFLMLVVSFVGGCSPFEQSVEAVRDDNFTQGCVGVTEKVAAGYLGNGISADICKVKCSPKLPKGFKFSYKDDRAGCKSTVGNINDA